MNKIQNDLDRRGFASITPATFAAWCDGPARDDTRPAGIDCPACGEALARGDLFKSKCPACGDRLGGEGE